MCKCKNYELNEGEHKIKVRNICNNKSERFKELFLSQINVEYSKGTGISARGMIKLGSLRFRITRWNRRRERVAYRYSG